MSEEQIEKIEKNLKDNDVEDYYNAGEGVYYSEKPFQYVLSPTSDNLTYYSLVYNLEKDIKTFFIYVIILIMKIMAFVITSIQKKL